MADKQIETWNATVLENMKSINTMIAIMQLISKPEQQLMLMHEDEDTPNPITGNISRHQKDDDLQMNSTLAKNHKNNDTMIGRHKLPLKSADG